MQSCNWQLSIQYFHVLLWAEEELHLPLEWIGIEHFLLLWLMPQLGRLPGSHHLIGNFLLVLEQYLQSENLVLMAKVPYLGHHEVLVDNHGRIQLRPKSRDNLLVKAIQE